MWYFPTGVLTRHACPAKLAVLMSAGWSFCHNIFKTDIKIGKTNDIIKTY
jgi:hypothetical protein